MEIWPQRSASRDVHVRRFALAVISRDRSRCAPRRTVAHALQSERTGWAIT
jgi:hypothetical protein